ncbi:hypothetical protein RSSM_00851 [Rhodopirellula sallentina SM41]|uniref:Uncharacterized protein n=1 Tax=Rhodopirellula sallentina SM41 TaxID=1263870 RepID=M5UNZ3_9BACT|nr:hypothetical protein RSSM_00851 [Rhodopirellula sallentina SM41]
MGLRRTAIGSVARHSFRIKASDSVDRVSIFLQRDFNRFRIATRFACLLVARGDSAMMLHP